MENREPRVIMTAAVQNGTVADTLGGTVFQVDTGTSVIRWRGTKFLGTAGHEGTLGIKEGFLVIRNDSLSRGTIIADMDAIRVTDIPVHDTANRYLANHLKSEFGTREYPIATFEITGITYLGGDRLLVRGDMRIRDVTRNISIPVTIAHTESGGKLFRTTFSLDRFAWNVGKDGSWLERRLVDKDFQLSIELTARVPG